MKKDVSRQPPQDRTDYLRRTADFAAILESLPGYAVVAVDFKGNIVIYNDGARQIYGYTPEEIIGKKNIAIFFPKEFIDGGKLPRLINNLRRKKRLSWEGEQVRKNGEEFPARILLTLLKDKRGKALGFMETVEDITERKEAEEEQAKAISKIGNAMGDGLVLHAADGKITFVNPAFEKIAGWKKDELLGKNVVETARKGTKPGDIGKITAAMEASLMGEVPVSASITFISKKGREIPALFTASCMRDAEGRPSTCVVVFKDISELKRAEEERRKAAASRTAVETIEGMPDAVTIYGLDGTIHQVNSEFERGLGWKRKEVIGKTALEVGFVSKEEGRRIKKEVEPKLLKEGFVRDFETIGTRKDGTQFPVLTNWALMKDDTGKPAKVIAVARDITERKKAEEALKESEEKYRSLITNIPDVTWTSNSQGTTCFISENVETVYGFTAEEIRNSGAALWFGRIHPDDIERVKEAVRRLFSDGEPLEHEYRIQRKDGRWIWIYDRSVSVYEKEGMLWADGIFSDITERKKLEEKYQELVETERDIIYSLDVTGNITFASPAVERILHYRPDEVTGQNFIVLIPEEWREKTMNDFNNLLKTGKITAETVLLDKEDQPHFVEYSSTVIKEGNKVVGTRGIARDVTERKKLERAAQRETEERCRMIYESSRDGIATANLEGTITGCNQAYADMLGYTEEELKEIRYQDLTPPKWHALNEEIFHQVVERGYSDVFEKEYVRKDGTVFPVALHTWRIDDEEGNPVEVGSIVTDITERKKAEETLRESEERLRFLVELHSLENIPDFVINLDRNYKILMINHGIPGAVTAEQAIGTKVFDYVDPAHREIMREALETVFQTGTPQKYEVLGMGPEGPNTAWYETRVSPNNKIDDQVISVTLISSDITEHKKIKEALGESEEKYRAILQGIEDGYYEADYKGNFTFFNDALCRINGYSREEMMGMNYRQIMDKENARKVFQVFNGVYNTGKPAKAFGWEIIRKDGTKRFIEASASLIRNSEGERVGFRGIVRDITEHKEVDEALRESEERYRQLIELSPDGIAIESRGKIAFINPAGAKILGATNPKQLLGRSVMDFVHPDYHGIVIERMRQQKEEGKAAPANEEKYVRLDGTVIDVEVSSSPIVYEGKTATQVFVRDITQRKKVEETLIRLSNAVKMSTDSIVISNLKGKIIDVNEATLEMYGTKDKKDLIGKNSVDLIAPEDRERALAGVKETLEKGYIRNREYYVTAKDGSKLAVEMNVGVMKDVDGKPMGFVGITRDITGRREAETRKRELEQKAQVASRLSTVGEMASGIAHEVNNPLTSVIGFAWLLMQKDVPEDIKEYARYINDGAERVASIVGRLLTFARQQKPEKAYADINRILETTLQLQAYEMETSNIKVTTRFDPDLPQTIVDPGQFQQVFLNIILNATTEMKLAHKGGKLVVKTERIDATIRISFKDDGPGIAEENLEKIFEPFFTTRKPGAGTGLGLSVCHGIIAEHNGQIYARNNPGRGATFIIELPIATEQEQPETAKPAAAEPLETAKAKILVVDDEPATLQLLSQVLSAEGYEVQTVDNADDALQMIKNEGYNLILLDIKMPGMSGIELYQNIQQAAPALIKRVAFITGDSMSSDTRNFLVKSKVFCIIKPFNIVQLKRDINRLLARRA